MQPLKILDAVRIVFCGHPLRVICVITRRVLMAEGGEWGHRHRDDHIDARIVCTLGDLRPRPPSSVSTVSAKAARICPSA